MAKLLLLLLPGVANAVDMTPMQQTVGLIEGLRSAIAADGKSEQESFDKYACWCEKTMERKASDIAHAKELVADTQVLIKKLKGEIGAHGAEIEGLKKDIANNHAAVKEATDLRNKENGEYANDRAESEQCIGAMEAAIKVLTGAGTKSFLQGTFHEAELLSVIQGVRNALNNRHTSEAISNSDIEVMKHFVSKPEDFVSGKKVMSAAQIGQNPFGDYAPQSTQIQGILKGMYDAFTAELEKDNANEADTQKSFEELMATKAQELATLEGTLMKNESDEAAKAKKLSESELLADDTAGQQKADETFFEDTKEACQAKATQWSVRTRLRTEELNGMDVAVKILSSDGAKKTFKSATTTFVQLSTVKKHMQRSSEAAMRSTAYAKLRVLAGQSGSHARSVAKIAVELKTGGHFDKVIAMVDDMIGVLRQEEQDDIEHRDRCENDQNANKNTMADLKGSIKKTNAALDRMRRTRTELKGDVSNLDKEIESTNADMAEALKQRNEEEANFIKALKDDTDAVALLKKAIVALSKYYTDNKIALPALVQAPEYEQDDDKAPETNFAANDSRKSESGGILAILEMLVEDSTKEIAEGRADNADAQAKYLKMSGALQDTLDSQEETKANTETELADLNAKITQYKKFKNEKNADKAAEEDTKGSIATDCDWVKTNFQSRREKRKTEIQGLVDAKAFLAGVAAGQDPLPM